LAYTGTLLTFCMIPSRALFDNARCTGHVLKTLYVDRCILGAKRTDRLKKHVQEFHWDGKEEFPREK